MSKPRAFTLIEMLVSISAGTVLLSLALGMVHRSMHIESAARTQARSERTITRLSHQFRQDVRRAQSVSQDNQVTEVGLEIVLPKQASVSYRTQGNDLLRVHKQSDGEIQQELYALPAGYSLQFDQRTDPQRVALTIHRDTGLYDVPPQLKLHVEATVGKFLQLTEGI